MSEQKETVFLDGFIFKRPKEGAPDFVKGEMSIKVDEAVASLQKNAKNGWINADLLASKDNSKLYFKLNTWEKPVDATAPVNAGEDTREAPPIAPEDIPF